MQNLFSYGTLQLQKVQKETFGRILKGKKDKLHGFKLTKILIKDDKVVSLSGKSEHLIIEYTGEKNHIIEGVLFQVTDKELRLADSYETNDYKRIKVMFLSKKYGWVYIKS
ncbi:MAG: UDP-N-acetylmuramate--alanine ligase [Flavobacteriaceae bacterium]|nr:UDP-N-acetylmuramate--alanine ligase [Flavobacteriaceae bacterium]|tara:strand:- start:672 stop:1004 length:333 start_codon:yes stop_codon:yes gene_type:complete